MNSGFIIRWMEHHTNAAIFIDKTITSYYAILKEVIIEIYLYPIANIEPS